MVAGIIYQYDAAGTDLTTGDGRTWFKAGGTYSTVALLKSSVEPSRGVGEIWVVDGPDGRFSYEEVASGAHLTNGAGVLLQLIPDATGYNVKGLGAQVTTPQMIPQKFRQQYQSAVIPSSRVVTTLCQVKSMSARGKTFAVLARAPPRSSRKQPL